MTMPHLMNCLHSSDGWCLDCVKSLVEDQEPRSRGVMCISVRRTGNIKYQSASEFAVVYPDGSSGTIWSPPWHEFDDDTEDMMAMKFAIEEYIKDKGLKDGEEVEVPGGS